jgi:hypothetical protein
MLYYKNLAIFTNQINTLVKIANAMIQKLNLPPFEINVKDTGKSRLIFDVVRKKFIALTPEEWVRQHFVNYLIEYKNFPIGLISLELPLKLNKNNKRSDIVVYNKNANPVIIIECKAPEIILGQEVFDQAATYNMKLKVQYLIVTNGLKHFCCKVDYVNKKYDFLNDIPEYNEL